MSTTPRADTTPGPYLAAVIGEDSPNATTPSTSSPDSAHISVEAASPNPPASELPERMKIIELQQQQDNDKFSAISELLVRAIEHQGEGSSPRNVSPSQPPAIKASQILASQTGANPDSTHLRHSFLSSYRLRELDSHAAHKLPNGSRIKSVCDIVSLLKKDEPYIMQTFEDNDNATGHEMLRMIQSLANACENSSVRMEISTVVQVMVRVLTRDPDSAWTAKIDLLLSNVYSLPTRSGLKQLVATIRETGMCTRGPCIDPSESLWHAALTNVGDIPQVQEDYGLILEALSAMLTANATHEQQYAAATYAYDDLSQEDADDTLGYLVMESKLLAEMQAASGYPDRPPRSDEMRIQKLIEGCSPHVRDAITNERNQGLLQLFGMNLQEFAKHFVRISNYSTDAQLRNKKSNTTKLATWKYGNGKDLTVRGCATRSIPVEEQSNLRKDVMANVTANHAAKFEQMQAEALALGLAFCEFHGWTTHETKKCPEPLEDQHCMNWTKGGYCARGRKCKYMHAQLPPVPSQAHTDAKVNATRYHASNGSRASQAQQAAMESARLKPTYARSENDLCSEDSMVSDSDY